MTRVEHQFVQVGERRVFVRGAGHGPAVVLLHQSPQNGRAMRPWIERLADRFAVLAPDTPGLGLSDPLPRAQPTIPELADALVAWLDALGLQRVVLLGVHTGAVIAARVALQHPARVAAVLCDGLALFDDDERRVLLDAYLPPFEPQWDGSHLRWLWARLREQHLFFPWHAKDATHRLAYGLPDAAKLHADTMDVLLAGDGYRAVYRAPFLFRQGRESAARLAVPTWLLYRSHDVLAPHASRLPALPPAVRLVQADSAAIDAAIEAALAESAPGASEFDVAAGLRRAGSASRRVVAVGPGEASLAWRVTPGQGALELVLPDLGSAAAHVPHGVDGATRAVLEWPGHGASLGWAAPPSIDGLLDALDRARAMLPAGPVRLQADGGACALALAWAQRLGAHCERIDLCGPLPLNDAERARFLAGLPEPRPEAHGAHLLAAWDWARLRALFPAWEAAAPERAWPVGSPPPLRVQADVVEMLQAGALLAGLWQLALDVDLPRARARVLCPVTVTADPSSPASALAQRLAAATAAAP